MRLYCALVICMLAASAVWAFEAGTGKVDITGPIGAPLNGYGDRMGRGATGIHDPLWARALYLNDGKTGVFLLNCDLTAITRELREKVLELAPQVTPATHIILTATHTHNAQGGMFKQIPPRFVGGRFMPEVLDATAQGIANAMKQAYEQRQRATIGYGTFTQNDLSVNRRFENGPIDEQVGIIRVDNADGTPIALLANFAAHPTSVPKEDHLSYSADYPGFYYEELEKLSPENCMAMFMNGAEGNQTIAGPPDAGSGWARTEAVGRLLAQRVHKAAQDIVCVEATLLLNAVEAPLPPTLATSLQPGATLLQTLEIDDLLITFFPGEAVVDIGLEMRRQALTYGYKAQFSVGLANDYLMYFVPKSFYYQVNYEATMNFFGPDIAEWFYRHFLSLASRATPPDAPPTAQHPNDGGQLDGVHELLLEGNGYQRGVQRALAFPEEFDTLYNERIVAPIRIGTLLPKTGSWALLPPFMDPLPLALPVLGMANRPLLENISEDLFDEMRGIAEASGKPFDAVWLLQHAELLNTRNDKSPLFDAPLCTGVALMGEKVLNTGLLVGRTLDWAHKEKPVVTEHRPATGRTYVQVGFPWNVGVFNGMNDAGIVMCVERMHSLGEAPLQGPSIEFFVADSLQNLATFAEALEAARAQKHLRGYHLLIAGMEEGEARAAVLEYGEKIVVREAGTAHLLLGADPNAENVDDDARTRYARISTLLKSQDAFDMDTLGALMHDNNPKLSGLANIWNEHSQFSIVFMPERKRLLLSVPDSGSKPGAYQLYQLGGIETP